MNESVRRYYLKQMGIDVWETRGKSPISTQKEKDQDFAVKAESAGCASFSGDEHSSPLQLSVSSLGELKKQAMACQACVLAKTRTHVVFGTGNPQADWMIVGEAPGFHEDQQGEPFVGRAGQLLNAMLASVGRKREEVYIANVLKCRPPNNRDPMPDEVDQCTPFLKEQIRLISPKVILALGRHAARFLLNTDATMVKLRGKSYEWGENHIPVFVSYHPAYLLRNPVEKLKAWMDWLLVKKQLK